jgi:uncharacterized protein (DUF1330 family)
MPKAYWIARIDVTNMEPYKLYASGSTDAIAKHGGKFLARGGRPEALQGEARARNVVIEFPNYEAALACWNSPEYKAAKAHRDGNADAEFVLVEGYEP